ncbi:putative DNA topoisomerase transcription factor interactor and regulator CCHC(Zn) family [Helianthus annuus]|nr:putative DNA topoisomerase transcription factor interactor and regulator CCHC(Zn) family [Helianthus annuus]
MREGRSRYNKIFEFNYTIQGQPCQMMFTSVTGHLMEMEFEGRYRKWHFCDPVDLFEAPIRKHVPEGIGFVEVCWLIDELEYLYKNNRSIPCGAHTLSDSWIRRQDSGGIQVAAGMMTKHILPFTRQNFQPENLDGKLYELVVRHYLACVSQPAVGAETTVEIDIAGEMFSALGRTIVAKNYLEVYRFESWGGSLIPNYTFGQQFTPTSLTLESGITRPPPLLSESDLLDCMDKAGIGTDATMHDHIKKLTDRFYAIKEGSHFKPTNLGEALVMGYDDMGYELWKPYLRSMMEEDMKAVSIGNKRKDDVLATCLQQMKACFLDARVNKTKLFQALKIFFDRTNRTTGGDDQHNHAQQLVRKCDDGKFMIGCSGYPQCRNVIWLPGSISEAVVTTTVCNMCTPGPVFKIQFTFRRLEIPPNFNVHHFGCVGGCDEIMRQLIEMSGSGQRNTSSTPARGRGIAAPSRNDSRDNNNNNQQQQQATCSFCHQTGHNSSDCYSLTSQNRSARSQRVNSNSGDSPIPCPTCGSLCVLKTANTESNRGRKFYSCQTQGCKFFVVPTTRGGGNGSATTTSRRGGRGGGDVRFVSATGDPVSGRSCFICGDPSHFANACPNRGMRN